MGAAVSTAKNKYYENRKDSNIRTPPGISQFIFDTLNWRDNFHRLKILDPAVGDGALLEPWQKDYPNAQYFGVDIKEAVIPGIKTVKANFLNYKPEDFKSVPNLIIINPPWNHGGLDPDFKAWLQKNKKSRCLLPFEFLAKCFELFGVKIPVVLITCWGLVMNNWRTSTRPRVMMDWIARGANNAWNTFLPNDIFPNPDYDPGREISMENQPNKEHQSLIMWWNIAPWPRTPFLPAEYIDMDRPRNTSRKGKKG